MQVCNPILCSNPKSDILELKATSWTVGPTLHCPLITINIIQYDSNFWSNHTTLNGLHHAVLSMLYTCARKWIALIISAKTSVINRNVNYDGRKSKKKRASYKTFTNNELFIQCSEFSSGAATIQRRKKTMMSLTFSFNFSVLEDYSWIDQKNQHNIHCDSDTLVLYKIEQSWTALDAHFAKSIQQIAYISTTIPLNNYNAVK